MARVSTAFYPGRILWATLLFIGTVDAIWLLATPINLGVRPLMLPGVVAFACLAWIAINRLLGSPRSASDFPAGIAFIMLGWPTLILLNHLTMSLPIPLTDELLASWDRVIGFDWHAYLIFVTGRPRLQGLLDWSYQALSDVALVVFMILFWARRERAQEFVEVFFLAAMVTVLIGALFPALTAFPHYQPPQEFVRLLPRGTGMSHVGPMAGLRSGEIHTITKLPGIVAFPSFHTAGALMIAYSCRGLHLLFPCAALFAVVTIAATPIFGGHYLVDVIAGVVAALACILVHRSRVVRGRRRKVDAQVSPATRSG